MLEKLLEHGEKMRNAQKNYFATSSIERDKKRGFLNESKQAEREFDNVLFNLKQFLK